MKVVLVLAIEYVCGCVGAITSWLLYEVGFMLLLPEIPNRQEGPIQYYPLVLPYIIYWKVALVLWIPVGNLKSKLV